MGSNGHSISQLGLVKIYSKIQFVLNTTQLNGVRHMIEDHSDSERENPLPPHGLVFPISSKGYFICIIP